MLYLAQGLVDEMVQLNAKNEQHEAVILKKYYRII